VMVPGAIHCERKIYDMENEFTNLPEFDQPPVSEMALGVQFAPITGFTSGHYGWFWKLYLGSIWTKAQDANRLVPQFEKFDEKEMWQVPSPPIVIQNLQHADRILFINDDDDRIIQLQNDRFHYNWRKREQRDYPSFATINSEFRERLQVFETFVRDCGLENPLYNQWELTYFNIVYKGDLWNDADDWAKLFPGLIARADTHDLGLVRVPSISMQKFEIQPRRGHLYVVAQHVKAEDGREALQVNLTARGPVIADDQDWDLASGMARGHAALVRTFRNIASPQARAHWGER
jgi:uncharacterized protein (TIGR04255 family)